MRNWPDPADLQERYDYAEKKLDAAAKAQDPMYIQFYAGQLSVLGLFVEEDVILPQKEIAVHSPLNGHHPDFKVVDMETEEESLEYAEKFASNYREQAKKGGIHADKKAVVVYRYTTAWDKVKG